MARPEPTSARVWLLCNNGVSGALQDLFEDSASHCSNQPVDFHRLQPIEQVL